MDLDLFPTDSLKSNDSMNAENEIDFLKAEYENEKNYRDNALWRNKENEKAIVKLQEQLRKDDYEWELDGEFKNIIVKNKELSIDIENLKIELPELKEKLKNAKSCGKDCKMKHDNLNINLDLLSEIELIKTAKRLERMKTDIRSALISKEWSLDNESKNYQRIIDQKNHLQNQLYHTNPGKCRESYADRWQNGGIGRQYRTLDLKNGPIRSSVVCEKLLPPIKLAKKGK